MSITFLVACDQGKTTDRTSIHCNDLVIQAEINEQYGILYIHDKPYRLNRVVSASGEKYQNNTDILWLKGDDALIKMDSEDYKNCKVIGR